MQTKTWALAAAFALALSGASAEPNHPRIYYPRQVKRQIASNPSPETDTAKRGLLDDILGGLTGNGGSTTRTPTATSKTTKDDPTSSKDGILLGPTGIVVPGDTKEEETKEVGEGGKNNTSSATDESSSSDKPTKPGLLDPLPTLIGDILNPTPTEPSKETETTDPPTETTEPPKETESETESEEPTEPTTSKGGILDPLPTLITDILDPTNPGSVEPTANSTEPITEPTTTDNSVTDILPSITLFPPDPTTTDPTTSDNETTTEPPLIPTDILPPPITTPGSSVPTTTDGPINSTTTDVSDLPSPTTDVPTEPTEEPTEAPTEAPEPPPVNSTEPGEPVTTPPTVLPPDEEPTVVPTPSSSPQEPVETSKETSDKPKPPVTSIEPTATRPDTGDWMPTTIVADPTDFTYTKPTAGQPTETALPTDIPMVITPNDPDKKAIPDGSVMIQIGFDYSLNYKHVAKNPIAAAQIFKFLPPALSFAGGFKMDKVLVSELTPYDTRDKWGYMTTIAKVYYPEALVDTLKMDLLQPNSNLYNNPNNLVNDLTADINPNIDIFGNINEGEAGGPGGNKNDEDGSGGSGPDNDVVDSGDSGNSSAKQQATTAGIAVGAFGLSVMYGAAMFIVARRYKRKRQAHRRSSSITGSEASSEMQYARNGSPAMMGGALLSQDMSHYGGAGGRDSHGSGNNSARTANISAPVATENSLGWN